MSTGAVDEGCEVTGDITGDFTGVEEATGEADTRLYFPGQLFARLSSTVLLSVHRRRTTRSVNTSLAERWGEYTTGLARRLSRLARSSVVRSVTPSFCMAAASRSWHTRRCASGTRNRLTPSTLCMTRRIAGVDRVVSCNCRYRRRTAILGGGVDLAARGTPVCAKAACTSASSWRMSSTIQWLDSATTRESVPNTSLRISSSESRVTCRTMSRMVPSLIACASVPRRDCRSPARSNPNKTSVTVIPSRYATDSTGPCAPQTG